MTEKPKTGLRRPSSVGNLRAAAAAPAPLAASVESLPEPGSQPVAAPSSAPKAKEWPVRIPLNVDDEMRRALEQARVDDRVETTARIRAMIHLWQVDGQFRDRVNELAPSFRPAARGPRR